MILTLPCFLLFLVRRLRSTRTRRRSWKARNHWIRSSRNSWIRLRFDRSNELKPLVGILGSAKASDSLGLPFPEPSEPPFPPEPLEPPFPFEPLEPPLLVPFEPLKPPLPVPFEPLDPASSFDPLESSSSFELDGLEPARHKGSVSRLFMRRTQR
jgi:hypothetical protein